ncbi:hypothetical protein Bpfe_003000 [Biomphalaria pfeifferi]|uniref:Uncharacterized protein n=1 Tax=Biomphalaria pfeifferi TaxID=112525 RepID=A0AAD8C873_BIOPF|nr:hypothetical protein Bpfe_003000 [Biomphalaria pfeifferi]
MMMMTKVMMTMSPSFDVPSLSKMLIKLATHEETAQDLKRAGDAVENSYSFKFLPHVYILLLWSCQC